jgi:hypothetical protein
MTSLTLPHPSDDFVVRARVTASGQRIADRPSE